MVEAREPRSRAIAAAAAVAALALWATLRPAPGPALPARCPAARAEPWMADCLTGIGARRREAAAAALRSGRLDLLPPAARGEARAWFDPPAAGWTDRRPAKPDAKVR